ncbi:MAG: hypothetical protein HYV63_23285 [Candidatus Schekmanbacteria bacterium]|nr:hypothetical protein [Candidatus Schekmanbacteria bacterium]
MPLLIGAVAVCAAALGSLAQAAISITADADWSPSVGAADLQAGPGSNLAALKLSPPGHVVIEITGTTGNFDFWQVDVHRVNFGWHPSLGIAVKRMGPGAGPGAVNGGLIPVDVTLTPTNFFSGRGDRVAIPIEVSINGISVAIPPATYTTRVVFTVIDI